MSQQGKVTSIDQKKCIVLLKKYFDDEKRSGTLTPTKDPVGRISEGLGIGKRTIETILANYNKDSTYIEKPHGINSNRPYVLNNDLVPLVRNHIRERNLSGQHVSIRSICSWLLQEYDFKILHTTLWRSLSRIGFTYGTGKRRSALKEKDYVIAARRKYLREKIKNRRKDGTTKRPEVYLDETYINKNHSGDNTWYLASDGPWVNKPTGKGERLIILHAITEDGWVKNAKLVFQANKSTGDYHGQMNFDNFSKWFTEQLLPNIPKNSIIIMDNAKYHNVLADNSFPTPRSKKSDLQKWLKANTNNSKEVDEMLKPELYERCRELAPTPEFKLDKIAEKQGHTILRTPQYHCELQPIENCWGVVKNYCANNCDFTMKGLRTELQKGFLKVTKKTCRSVTKKMREREDIFWEEDSKFEEINISQEIEFNDEAYCMPEDCELEMV